MNYRINKTQYHSQYKFTYIQTHNLGSNSIGNLFSKLCNSPKADTEWKINLFKLRLNEEPIEKRQIETVLLNN